MHNSIYFFSHFLPILTLVNGLSLFQRDIVPSSFNVFKGAVLYKNGKQTSCELALTGLTSGFIAASCFDFNSDGTINTKSIYQVRLDNGAEGTAVFTATINPSDIHIHPDFDSTTMANNVAVVEFNKSINDNYVSFIAVGGIRNGTQDLYVRRGYDETNKEWIVPEITTRFTDDAFCSQNSGLFTANNNWMLCISQSATSVMSSNCKVAYGVVYRLNSATISLSAIYSHSVVYKTDTCGGGDDDGSSKRFDYYTILEKYIGFAAKALNRSIDITYMTGASSYSDHDVLSMNSPSFKDLSGTVILSGDLYGTNPIVKAPESTTSNLLSDSSTAAMPTSGSNKSTLSTSNTMDGKDVDFNSSTVTSNSKENNNDTAIASDSEAGSEDNNRNKSLSDTAFSTSEKDDTKAQSSMTELDSGIYGYGRLSYNQAMIIGISAPVSFVVLLVSLSVLYNQWWCKRKDNGINPYKIQPFQRRELLEIPGTRDIEPPTTYQLGSGHVPSWRESNAFSSNRQNRNVV